MACQQQYCLHYIEAAPNRRELIVDLREIGLSFDDVVARLNFLLTVEACGKKGNKKILKERQALKVIKEAEHREFVDLPALFERPIREGKGFYSCHRLFKAPYELSPSHGDKGEGKVFKNEGLVIGLAGKAFSYRVDWDEEKGLHLNIETADGGKIALLVKPLSERFGFSEQFNDKSGLSEEQCQQFIKLKFWLKMTAGYEKATHSAGSGLAFFIRSQKAVNESLVLNFLKKHAVGYNCEASCFERIKKLADDHALLAIIRKDKPIRDVLTMVLMGQFKKEKIYIKCDPVLGSDSEQEGRETPSLRLD